VHRRSVQGLTALLGTMGVLHFVAARPFDEIVPKWIPGSPRMWTYASGVAELTSAALLARASTRRAGGYAAAITLLAVYPANVQMALDNPPRDGKGAALWARLPLQVPMVLTALRATRA